MSVKPYSVSPMQLIFTQHRPRAPQRALSTVSLLCIFIVCTYNRDDSMCISYLQPGSDSEATLPEVSVRLTEVAEARLETSQAGRSELEPGGVFARSSDKGLEVHYFIFGKLHTRRCMKYSYRVHFHAELEKPVKGPTNSHLCYNYFLIIGTVQATRFPDGGGPWYIAGNYIKG